jgi:hypothetical protein
MKKKEKEVLKMLLDYFIAHNEIMDLRQLKAEAIKNQDYQLACDIRAKEKVVMKLVPSAEQFVEARKTLNQNQTKA